MLQIGEPHCFPPKASCSTFANTSLTSHFASFSTYLLLPPLPKTTWDWCLHRKAREYVVRSMSLKSDAYGVGPGSIASWLCDPRQLS